MHWLKKVVYVKNKDLVTGARRRLQRGPLLLCTLTSHHSVCPFFIPRGVRSLYVYVLLLFFLKGPRLKASAHRAVCQALASVCGGDFAVSWG